MGTANADKTAINKATTATVFARSGIALFLIINTEVITLIK